MYTQAQFRQHMDNVRRYSYLQGQNQKLAWLYEKYSEARLTESMECQFVYDVDTNLEDLAKGLQNEDFMAVMNYWTELSMKYWTFDQRQAFLTKLTQLRNRYQEEQAGEANSLQARLQVLERTCSEILKHKDNVLQQAEGSSKGNKGPGCLILILMFVGMFIFAAGIDGVSEHHQVGSGLIAIAVGLAIAGGIPYVITRSRDSRKTTSSYKITAHKQVRESAPPQPPTPIRSSEPVQMQYKFIAADNREYGPVTTTQLRQWIAEGRANNQTLVQVINSGIWKPLASFPDLTTKAAVPPPITSNSYKQKSKIAAGLLGVFLGGLGIHRFYLGYIGLGITQIFVSMVTMGVGSLWGLIEGILILSGGIKTDAHGTPLR